jgi:hypothetical protein
MQVVPDRQRMKWTEKVLSKKHLWLWECVFCVCLCVCVCVCMCGVCVCGCVIIFDSVGMGVHV